MTQGMVVWSLSQWSLVDPDPDSTSRTRWIVVDRSPQARGEKAVRVYGPSGRADCEAWMRVSAGLFTVVMGQTPDRVSEAWR